MCNGSVEWWEEVHRHLDNLPGIWHGAHRKALADDLERLVELRSVIHDRIIELKERIGADD